MSDFVFSYSQTGEFMDMLLKLLDFLIPHYVEEGKVNLVVAVGCTGGRHRSVAIANALRLALEEKGVACVNVHRDIDK